MTQKKEVKGILLKREVLGEYSEKLTFFTNLLGKVIFYSYGSKSPKSRRRAILAYPALLKIIFEKKRFHRLVELQRIAFLWKKDSGEQNSFLQLLPHIHRHLPFHAKDKQLFRMLESFADKKVLQLPANFLNVLFLGSFLQHLGVINSHFCCNGCKKLCSENIIVLQNRHFWGEECHHNYVKKKINTSADPLSPIALILTPHTMALIKTLNKSTMRNINIPAFYEMYQQNFAKDKKKEWAIAYKYLKFISKTS